MQARINILSPNFIWDGVNFIGTEFNTPRYFRRDDNSASGSSSGSGFVFLPGEQIKKCGESSNSSSVDMGVDSLSNTFMQLDLMRNARQQLQERNSMNHGGKIVNFVNCEEDPRKYKDSIDLPEVHHSRSFDMMGKRVVDENQEYFQAQPLLSHELELLWYKNEISQLRSKVKVLLHEKLLLGKEIERMNELLNQQRFSEPLPEYFPSSTSAIAVSTPKVELPQQLDFNIMSSPSTWNSTPRNPIPSSSSGWNPIPSSPSTWSSIPSSPSGWSPITSSPSPSGWSPITSSPSPSAWSPITSSPSPSAWSPITSSPSPSAWSPITSSPSTWSPLTSSPSTWSPITSSPSSWNPIPNSSWTQPIYPGNSGQDQASDSSPNVFRVPGFLPLASSQPDHVPGPDCCDSMGFNHGLPEEVGDGFLTEEGVPALPESLEDELVIGPKEIIASDLDVCRFDFKALLKDVSQVDGAYHSDDDIPPRSSHEACPDSLNVLQKVQRRQEKTLVISSPRGFNHAHQGQMKTELCKNWKAYGDCPYSTNCRFAHGVRELRPIIRHPLYKTQICRRLLEGKKCIYSHRCHFRHALTEEEVALISRLRRW